MIAQAAQYTFLIKPAAPLQKMNHGIPEQHHSFWKQMTVENLYMVDRSLSVSTAKVLQLLQEPNIESASQSEVWGYLETFVGNMTIEELRIFLRFVTGSFVVSIPAIYMAFNALDGLARRPISHTCSATLELSTAYSSNPEFSAEFQLVLSDPYYSWRMDSL